MPDAIFGVADWFKVARDDPKAARSLVRTACETVHGASTTLGESSPGIKALATSYSCVCGWIGPSIHAFHAHRGSAHGVIHPAEFYVDDSCQCRCCLVTYGSRGLLIAHLRYGSGICLLNCVLHSLPLARDKLDTIKEEDSSVRKSKIKAGLSKHRAVHAPVREFGPLWDVVGLDGLSLDPLTDHRHPFGPQKRKFARPCFPNCDCPECIV